MKLFTYLYEVSLRISKHRHAQFWLCIVSFTESTFFIIPPDIILAPMTLTKPKLWLRLASLTTLFSVVGGAVGYLLGYWLIDYVMITLEYFNQLAKFELAKEWFDTYGIWVIIIASFSPIPYKIFTITSGTLSFAFLPFIIISLIGRGLRFFLVAGLIAWKGEVVMNKLHKYIDTLGWALVGLVIIYILIKNYA